MAVISYERTTSSIVTYLPKSSGLRQLVNVPESALLPSSKLQNSRYPSSSKRPTFPRPAIPTPNFVTPHHDLLFDLPEYWTVTVIGFCACHWATGAPIKGLDWKGHCSITLYSIEYLRSGHIEAPEPPRHLDEEKRRILGLPHTFTNCANISCSSNAMQI